MVIRQRSRGPSKRAIVIVGLVAILISMIASARFYTDVLWFKEVGFESVLFKSIYTQFFVGLAVGLVVAGLVWGNLFLAARMAPPYRITMRGGDPLERYRVALTPYTRWLRLGVSALIGIFAGVGASSSWQNYLLWANRVPFGKDDAQFGRDIGFFVFELPWLKDLTDFAWFALITALIVSAAAHFFYGSIRPDVGMRGVPPAVLAHLSVLLGCLALVKAIQYWLGRYELDFSARGVVTGASYTDVNAHLPALTILAIISIVSAILFLVNIRFRSVSLPLAAVGIWILFSVLAGGLWPWWVQRFSVEPQELQREKPFIQANLDATQDAFGVGEVEVRPFAASAELTPTDVETNEGLLANIRLWDPSILQQAIAQLQSIRTYYRFDDVDIDRYEIDGETRQVLVAARELSIEDLAEASRRWLNIHLQFTHGYGLVASLANATTSSGQPDFLVKDVPGTVATGAETLAADQRSPRLYFGESFSSSEYSVVNSGQAELDFETDEGIESNHYDGQGGIPISNILRKFAFAIREFDQNLLISGQVTNDSRMMLYKNVRDRVNRAAPFLSLDNDPYPAVVDGSIVWIADAYTTTSWYPYGQRYDVDEVVEQQTASLTGDISYIRNSVKIVIDAYNGTMKFYVVDEEDPLIQVWRNAFPELFTDEEPSEDLQAHFRYPEDLFKVQSEVYLAYHVQDPELLFSTVDEWAIPLNVSDQGASLTRQTKVQPTYLLLTLPGETDQEFLLTQPFTPRAKDNMISVLVARSDPQDYGELVNLQFSRAVVVKGPKQIDNLINQERDLAQELSLLRQGGSRVDFGSLVILPIEDSILYVQPFFVTAEDGGIPELKRVILVLGDDIAFADTFELALADLLQTQPPIAGEPIEPPDGQPPPPTEQPSGGRLSTIIDEAGRVYARAQEALQDGDFETYGRLIERLGNLIQEAEQLSSRT
jgi:uncharacterized membrane protein (UPF0182 family)